MSPLWTPWTAGDAAPSLDYCFRFRVCTRALVCFCLCLVLSAAVSYPVAAQPAEDGPGGSWLGQAQQEMDRREYFPGDNGQGLQAPNRAQGFRTYFDEQGIALVSRTAASEPLAAISVVAYGRAGDTAAIGPGILQSNDAQVTLNWPNLEVRFENSPAGLAAEWTVSKRPDGAGLLSLDLDIDGISPEWVDANGVDFSSSLPLRLDFIAAHDAQGRELELALKPVGGGLSIAVDDAQAKYPIKIQSVVNGVVNGLLESNQVGAQLGWSVAGAGDVNGDGYADVIVGAPNYDNGQTDEGAAFVYFGGPGAFNTIADALLESNQAEAYLGYSVAGAGDVNGDGYDDVIAGAYFFDNGQTNEGAAFVYFGGPGAFNTVADAQLESNQEEARLGLSVAGAGDVNGDGYADVIVGAYYFDNGQANEGAAFIYFGGAGAFNVSADAQLESNQPDALMGYSASGAGDVNGDGYADVIVGALFYDNGQTDEGVAFIYFGGAGAFNTVSDALLEYNQADAYLGSSVAAAGDVNGDGFGDVIVGAYYYDNGQTNEGVALIYFGGAGAFNAVADTLLEMNLANSYFGISVAGAGDINGDGYADVIVGSHLFDNGQNDEGAAFVYFGGPSGVDTISDATLESNQNLAYMGSSVAGAGDVNGDGFADVIVGSYAFNNPENDEGAGFVYFGGVGAFNIEPDAQLVSFQVQARMGTSVAGAGDVNGDGYADVIVAAPGFDNGQADEGAVFLYLGGPGALDITADAVLESNQGSSNFGASAAGAGDVNGDGYADVIVGALFYDNGQTNEGVAFIYFGGPGAFNTIPDALLESNQADAYLGSSVAAAGDVNGDGFADVIVGALSYDNGQTDEGVALIYFGGLGAFNTVSDALLEANQADAHLGIRVAGAGDVNGDGYADVIVGANVYDNGQADEGAVFLYLGGPGTFDPIADAFLESNQGSSDFGGSVAGAGDVNGDGYADVIVGALFYDNGQTDEGVAFIYFGGPGAFDTAYDALLESNQEDARLGNSVAGAGDVNGDGYADVIVGAYQFDSGESNDGAAFMYFGGPGVFDSTADAQLELNQPGALLGTSVAGAGDVNGDGYADVIVGAPSFILGILPEGAAFVYFGNDKGRLTQARQFLPGGIIPVDPWGLSQLANGFTVRTQATSPRGRERARLQLEACPPGAPFGSLLCTRFTQSSWTELGANSLGSNLTLTATGLDPSQLYHWRSRAQYAPLTVTAAGITAPPSPKSGPWRRLQGNGNVADIRTGSGPAPGGPIFKNGFE